MQLCESLIMQGRDPKDRGLCDFLMELLGILGSSFEVDFIEDDQGRLFQESGLIGTEFILQDAEVVDGITAFDAGDIDDVDQGCRSFDMTEKFKAKATVLVGSFDDARDVGNEDAVLFSIVDVAEVGKEGCERIGADFNREDG